MTHLETIVAYLRSVNNVTVNFQKHYDTLDDQIFIYYVIRDTKFNIQEVCHITVDGLSVSSINLNRIEIPNYFACKTANEVKQKLYALIFEHRIKEELHNVFESSTTC